MDRRLAWVDIAKGLGITLVVWGHVFPGLIASGLTSSAPGLQVVEYAIYTFHMPLFFFLSGIFVAESLGKGTRRFWTAKLATLIYPYFLWSLLQGGLQIAFARFANHQVSAMALLSIPWMPIQQFWFLYALFWCHIGYAVLHRAGSAMLLAVAACLFAATFCIDLGTASMPMWGFFYYALGNAYGGFVRGASPSPWLAIGLCLAFAAATAGALGAGLPSGAAVPSALCGIAATIALSQLLASRAELLQLLGSLSMSIYLMHVISVALARTVLVKIFHLEGVATHMVLGTAAGLMLPVAAHLLLARTGLLGWLGLGKDVRATRPSGAPIIARS